MINFCVQCSDTAVIYFDDVRVPAKNIIGEEGGSRLASLVISIYLRNSLYTRLVQHIHEGAA